MTPDPYEAALADEIVAEAKRKRLSYKYLQAETGTPQRTWSNYFVQKRNPIPARLLFQVAQILGTPLSVLAQRAEAQVAADDAHPAQLTTSERSAIQRGRKRHDVTE